MLFLITYTDSVIIKRMIYVQHNQIFEPLYKNLGITHTHMWELEVCIGVRHGLEN